MDEIELLRKQKKEIEARIRFLSNKTIESGEVRIGMEHYATDKPDRWYLAINVQNTSYKMPQHSNTYRTVVNANTKEEVIEQITFLIKDLQDLYDKAVNA